MAGEDCFLDITQYQPAPFVGIKINVAAGAAWRDASRGDQNHRPHTDDFRID
jgi:hypothetical protein